MASPSCKVPTQARLVLYCMLVSEHHDQSCGAGACVHHHDGHLNCGHIKQLFVGVSRASVH